MRYDRARSSLDRHASYIVAAYIRRGRRASGPALGRPVSQQPVRRHARPPGMLACRVGEWPSAIIAEHAGQDQHRATSQCPAACLRGIHAGQASLTTP